MRLITAGSVMHRDALPLGTRGDIAHFAKIGLAFLGVMLPFQERKEMP